MKITAKQVFITKCILWIISIIIVPIFLWHRPSHTYKSDKSTIKIVNVKNGKKFEFDIENTFGHKMHAIYVPQIDEHQYTYYVLYINNEKHCRVREFIFKDTYTYVCVSTQITFITLLILFIQTVLIATILRFLNYYKTKIKLKVKEKPGKKFTDYVVHEPYIYYGSDIKSDDLWFSKIFRLHTTWEQLVSINKFFGYDISEEMQFPSYETMLNNNYFHNFF